MSAVIDAVGKARGEFTPIYEQWASELPAAAKDPKTFEQWAGQFPQLFGAASALGLDPTGLAVTFDGHMPTSTRPASVRRRTRPKARRRTTTATNGTPSGEQILAHLQEHPGTSAKQLAKTLGASYDTVQKRMSALESEGMIRREGERNATRWFAGRAAGV